MKVSDFLPLVFGICILEGAFYGAGNFLATFLALTEATGGVAIAVCSGAGCNRQTFSWRRNCL